MQVKGENLISFKKNVAFLTLDMRLFHLIKGVESGYMRFGSVLGVEYAKLSHSRWLSGTSTLSLDFDINANT